MDQKNTNLPVVALLMIVYSHVTFAQIPIGQQRTCWIPQGGGYTNCRAPSSAMVYSQGPRQAMQYSVTIQDLNMWTLVCCRALACDQLYSDKCNGLKYISMGCGRTSFSKTLLWGPYNEVPEVQCQSRARNVNIKVAFVPQGRSDSRHQGRY